MTEAAGTRVKSKVKFNMKINYLLVLYKKNITYNNFTYHPIVKSKRPEEVTSLNANCRYSLNITGNLQIADFLQYFLTKR